MYLPLATICSTFACASWTLDWLTTPIALFLVGEYFLGQM